MSTNAPAPTLATTVSVDRSVGWGRLEWGLAGLLVALTLLTFSPVLLCEFINYDDDELVVSNPLVRQGLAPHAVLQSLLTPRLGNWHPLVALSYQVDGALYGINNPSGFHLTNLLWHACSVFVLFAALLRMTAAPWRAALAAALFALHPLNVEPVAWVAERKGVMSTFFWMVCLWGYARYAEKPGLARYLFVAGAMTLGLLSKAMLVTLPAVLLLLDYWPLRRIGGAGPAGDPDAAPAFPASSWVRLVAEKVPLAALSLVFAAIAFWTQHSVEALNTLEQRSLGARVENALSNVWWYLLQGVFPTQMALFHPSRSSAYPVLQAVGEAVLLVLVLGLSLWQVRRRAYLAVGLLWYLVALLPVSGLVQLGDGTRADRYAYVPLVGLFLLLSWGLAELARRWHRELPAAGLAALALAGLMLSSFAQTLCWHDSEAILEQTIRVTGGTDVAHWSLAEAVKKRGNREQAFREFGTAIQLNPRSPYPWFGMGLTLMEEGNLDGAIAMCQEALARKPNLGRAWRVLGVAQLHRGEPAKAEESLRRALEIQPESATAHDYLGLTLLAEKQLDEAEASFGRAIHLEPNSSEHHRGLALVLHARGHLAEAQAEYGESLRLDPTWPRQALSRAWFLATSPDPRTRHGRWALLEAEEVRQALGEGDPYLLDTLAAAHAALGQFPEAIALAKQALKQTDDRSLQTEIQDRLHRYEEGRPFAGGSTASIP